jgi:hypothetical protein
MKNNFGLMTALYRLHHDYASCSKSDWLCGFLGARILGMNPGGLR